jgi:hypothetical protein
MVTMAKPKDLELAVDSLDDVGGGKVRRTPSG